MNEPATTYFKPIGVPLAGTPIVHLKVDEFEALRLKDLEKLSQNEGAKKMGVSQPTFHRLLDSGHEKVARALVSGSAIQIGGGPYISHQAVNKISKAKEEGMEKIAISTNAGGLEDVVCPTFGRCPTFTLVEVEDKQIKKTETIPNPGAQMGMGAGISAAQAVINSGATAVIAGSIGPNASGVIVQAGIRMYSVAGKPVKDVVQEYIDGKLQKIETSNVPGHYGMGMGQGMGRGQAGFGMGRGRGAGQGRGRQQGGE